MVERVHVVVPGQPHLRNLPVLQQPYDGRREACVVQPEEEADVVGRHLHQRHLVLMSSGEAWTCLCVEPQNGLGKQEVNGPLSLMLVEHHYDAPFELCQWKLLKPGLVVLVVYRFLCHCRVLACKNTKKKPFYAAMWFFCTNFAQELTKLLKVDGKKD